MRPFRTLSIKGKLTAVTFLTTGGTLLLVGVLFGWYALRSGEQALERQLTAQAEIIGINAAPSIVFRDEKAAEETLAALRAESQIVHAGIYMPDGRPFATYARSPGGLEKAVDAGPPVEGFRSIGDRVVLTRWIGTEKRPIGAVQLEASLDRLRAERLRFAVVTGAILVLFLIAALGIGSVLQKTVSDPVLDLVQTARAVTIEKNYGIRATTPPHRGELGVLVESFNEMLDRIQSREAELVQTTTTLEREAGERRRAEDALRASEERYRLLFDSNPYPMWVFEEKTLAFLAVNDAACRQYGYSREEFLGMTIRDIRPSEDVASLMETLAGEPRELHDSGTWRHRKKDGTVIDVEITSHPVVFDGREGQIVLAADVTERRQLEQQLRQSQKMEAVGQLAGGVAHDFNNLLTVILGNADLQRSELEEGSPLIEPTEEIRDAAERAAALTRQLLAFSRRQVLEPKVLDFNALLTNLEKMLRRLISEDVRLITVLDPSAPRIRADAGQLEQIIVNLCVNARDAMPKGGTLTIETSHVDLDEGYAREHLGVQPGPYVMLAVTDTGIGMDPDTKSRIFEPFFTTKGPGKGTGLGLATVYGIVKQSGGQVWVYSELGRGTSFKIYFPRVTARVDEARKRVAAEADHGTETLLLVEDENSVRSLSRRILEARGYTVIDMADPDEAIAVAASRSGPIDLVLTDVVMPKMGGVDLAARIAAVRPEVKVLYMSGYTDDAIVRNGLIGEGGRFVQKPFTPAVLAKKVREALDD